MVTIQKTMNVYIDLIIILFLPGQKGLTSRFAFAEGADDCLFCCDDVIVSFFVRMEVQEKWGVMVPRTIIHK